MSKTNKGKYKTKNQKYVEKWLRDNGFGYHMKNNFISYCTYVISKDDITYDLEIRSGIEDIKAYMNMFKVNWIMKVELEKLRKEVNALI